VLILSRHVNWAGKGEVEQCPLVDRLGDQARHTTIYYDAAELLQRTGIRNAMNTFGNPPTIVTRVICEKETTIKSHHDQLRQLGSSKDAEIQFAYYAIKGSAQAGLRLHRCHQNFQSGVRLVRTYREFRNIDLLVIYFPLEFS
jgi:hypothetical protein